MKVEIFDTKPSDFNARVEVAACYLEVEGKFLLLQIPDGKDQSGCWGVPAGKLEPGETPEAAAIRELYEETGIKLLEKQQCDDLGALYIRKPGIDFVYHLFRIHLDHMPTVILSLEHTAYCWATLEEAAAMPLMAGAHDLLTHYRLVP